MYKSSRLEFDTFCVLNKPVQAAVGSTASGIAIVLGGALGYSLARVETTHLMSEQGARHTKEILRVRDEYGAKATSTRESVRQAAECASEAAQAAQAAQAIVEKIGPSVKNDADRANAPLAGHNRRSKKAMIFFPCWKPRCHWTRQKSHPSRQGRCLHGWIRRNLPVVASACRHSFGYGGCPCLPLRPSPAIQSRLSQGRT